MKLSRKRQECCWVFWWPQSWHQFWFWATKSVLNLPFPSPSPIWWYFSTITRTDFRHVLLLMKSSFHSHFAIDLRKCFESDTIKLWPRQMIQFIPYRETRSVPNFASSDQAYQHLFPSRPRQADSLATSVRYLASKGQCWLAWPLVGFLGGRKLPNYGPNALWHRCPKSAPTHTARCARRARASLWISASSLWPNYWPLFRRSGASW